MINKNNLARTVSFYEGKKVQVNIAQIKEVMRVLFELLAERPDKEIITLINKVRKGRKL